MTVQYFSSEVHGPVQFEDARENHHSVKCKPEHIELVSVPTTSLTDLLPHEPEMLQELREEIADDINRVAASAGKSDGATTQRVVRRVR